MGWGFIPLPPSQNLSPFFYLLLPTGGWLSALCVNPVQNYTCFFERFLSIFSGCFIGFDAGYIRAVLK
jgi:hypothetical protein